MVAPPRVDSSLPSQTLVAFLSEAGLPEDAATTNPGDWTIEIIIDEKRRFDTSLSFEKKSNGESLGWSLPAPTNALSPSLPNFSNVLCVTALPVRNKILTTHADKSLHQVLGHAPYDFHESNTGNDSPILSLQPIGDAHLLSTSMSGQVALRDTTSGLIRSKRRDHLKMVVQAAIMEEHGHCLIATAGWDQKVIIYATDTTAPKGGETEDDDDLDFFGDPIHTITLATVPESLLFVRQPDTNNIYLIFSRRDSSFLYYYLVASNSADPSKYTILPSGRQNLAPHSNAWVAFTPSCLNISPKDPTLLAVATSHLPHMKLILVRLLFPTGSAPEIDAQQTPSSQARASLALQDREDTAITLHVTTMAPQTPYSTPQVVWRPDATGVWVNGDDGVIRGIEVNTGKVVSILKGHEAGSKVRTLWAGHLRRQDGEEREVLVSGGFDKQVLIWDCGDANGA